MVRRSRRSDPQRLRRELVELLIQFESRLNENDLRDQVRALVPTNHLLRDLGSSLMPNGTGLSAKDRILAYLRQYVAEVIDGDELMVVAGISEYARRIRELRVECGWPILTGHSLRDMQEEDAEEVPGDLKPDQYVLAVDEQDEQAAQRWVAANNIRKRNASVKDKVLEFFRANVGQRITSEELRYVASNRSEWARRTRELRTEEGWPIVTRFSGDPTLPSGVYVLARDEQGEVHDRHISEITRREVLKRDAASCRWHDCGWPMDFPASDHRFLEVHHIEHHTAGGSNEANNLVTLCNLHHDLVHKEGKLKISPLKEE